MPELNPKLTKAEMLEMYTLLDSKYRKLLADKEKLEKAIKGGKTYSVKLKFSTNDYTNEQLKKWVNQSRLVCREITTFAGEEKGFRVTDVRVMQNGDFINIQTIFDEDENKVIAIRKQAVAFLENTGLKLNGLDDLILEGGR